MRKKKAYRKYTRSVWGNIFYFAFLIIFGAFAILPLIYTVITSFKPLDELLIFPPRFYVVRPTLENYKVLPTLLSNLKIPLSRYVFNSLFVSIISTVAHIFVASGAAYTISKSKIKYKNIVFSIVQFALLFNAYTLAIPRYLIYSNLRMIDTYWVYILPYIPSALGVFLMKQFMDTGIPDALLEAAAIDGAGQFRVFFRIALPLVKPAWLTLALFAFRDMWTVVGSGTIFTESMKTLPEITTTIASGGLARSGSAMAMSVIMMVPPIIVYLISQNSVKETMSTSGIK